MCVVSMVMDHYRDKWWPLTPNYPSTSPLQQPNLNPIDWDKVLNPHEANKEPAITDAEIREFRSLLERAREYDKKHHEPECEDAGKKAALKEIAKIMGINIDFIDEEAK